MKNRNYIIGGALLLTLMVFVMIFVARRTPSIPNEWISVQAGMSKEEIQMVVQDTFDSIDPIRRVEIATRSYNILGIRKCRWQLYIEYDEKDRANMVQAGFFNANNKPAFLPPWRPLQEF